jgi:hypothetical protein
MNSALFKTIGKIVLFAGDISDHSWSLVASRPKTASWWHPDHGLQVGVILDG